MGTRHSLPVLPDPAPTSVVARGAPPKGQPTQQPCINREHPLGRNDWRLLWVPNPLFAPLGKVTARPTLGGSSAYGVGPLGYALHTNSNIANNGATWSDAALQLDVNSGVAVVHWRDTVRVSVLSTRFVSFLGSSGFEVAIEAGGQVFLNRQNFSSILGSSNVIASGSVATIAWSYNLSTGAAILAVNGVVTSGTNGAGAFIHGNFNVGGHWTDANEGAGINSVYLVGFSATEVKNADALAYVSRYPWGLLN